MFLRFRPDWRTLPVRLSSSLGRLSLAASSGLHLRFLPSTVPCLRLLSLLPAARLFFPDLALVSRFACAPSGSMGACGRRLSSAATSLVLLLQTLPWYRVCMLSFGATRVAFHRLALLVGLVTGFALLTFGRLSSPTFLVFCCGLSLGVATYLAAFGRLGVPVVAGFP